MTVAGGTMLPTHAGPGPARSLRSAKRAYRGAGAVLIGLVFFVPILYVLMISVEPSSHFLVNPLQPPLHPAVDNFGKAWNQANLGVELINTVVYSVIAGGLSTGLSLLIAFPIGRKLIKHSSWIYGLIVVGLFLPLSIIPLFIEARLFDLFNNRIGYIILHVEPGLPLGVVLLTAFIVAVPKELDEAAWLDGASYLRYLWSVVVPLTWPALLIAFLYSLLGVWNDIIGPVVLLSNPNLFPVTRGIYNFYGATASDWPLLAAGIIIVSLPVAALFVASQRRLIQAAMTGSVKG
ncbi:MAG: carbohydrate ABC transporter permease [Acidimicrobiales bacterium]